MKTLRFIVLGLGLAALAAAAPVRPISNLLGIELGMPDVQVRRRLEKLGEPFSGPDSPKQSWRIKHPTYAFVALRYDADWRVRWVTAFPRRDGTRLRFSGVGPMSEARRLGNWIYVWEVRPPHGASYRVTARGSDSLFVSSVSLLSSGSAEDSSSTSPSDPD